MILTIAHGDIETAEEQESLDALRAELETVWVSSRGTNDTTAWTLAGEELPPVPAAMLHACRELYPWWKVSSS
jgi:hypothetical protein